jgi:hypothetical protein
MVLKGGVLENKRRRRRDMEFFCFFFGEKYRKALDIYGRKPQTMF